MRKKLLSLTFLFVACIGSIFAQDGYYDFSVMAPTGQSLYYIITGSGTVTVSQLTFWNEESGVTSGELTIPESVSFGGNTYSVTEIGYRAFAESPGLTSVTIPNSVITIGQSAFEGCTGLTSVTIPNNSVTEIGAWAFKGCTSLTSVTIPNSVTRIGDYYYFRSFEGCTSLTSVTISCPASIVAGVFNGSGLTSPIIINDTLVYVPSSFTGDYSIPYGVTTIGSYAFGGCSELTSVTIPITVSTISSFAFSGCTGLFPLTIPNSVTTISDYAYAGIKMINYHGSASYNEDDKWGAQCKNGYVNNGLIYTNSDKEVLIGALPSIVSATIPNTVNTIMAGAFAYCKNLTSVIIPNTVDTIMAFTFEGCKNLTSVTIPSSVNTIEEYAFSGCSNLSLAVPSTVRTIEQHAFDTVMMISYSGTYTYGSPWGAWYINGYKEGDFCYANSTKQTLVRARASIATAVIPNTVTTIKDGAFMGCKNLTSVTIPNSVTTIGTSDDYSYFPNSEYPSGGPFCGCTGLTSVTIPNSVTTIGRWAFMDCTGLTSVAIGNSVTTIEQGAFEGCKGLTTVAVPSSVTYLSGFGRCTGLTSVSIPNSVTTIGVEAFSECNSLESITIPNTVTTIEWSAFGGCNHLMSVTIPNSVTTLGDWAFGGCRRLSPVYIPNTVTTIGDNAFELVRLIAYEGNATGSPWGALCMSGYIEDSLYYLNRDKEVLVGAHPLITTADIPSTVTSIGPGAFYRCENLQQITLHTSNPPDRTASSFAFVDDDITVQVPCGAAENYRNAPLWSHFHNFEEVVPFMLVVNTVSDTTEGHVDIIEAATCNSFVAVILATANEGYHFTMWSDGVTDNPRSVFLISDTVLTALFAKDLGIEDVEDDVVAMYPNPTSGMLYVAGDDVVRVDVYDIGGRRVMSAENVKSVDLSTLPSGMYYIRVVHSHGVSINKVVKK